MLSLIKLKMIVILSLCFFQILAASDEFKENVAVDLKTGRASETIRILKNNTSIIEAVNIPVNFSILIYEAHSQIENLTISDLPTALIHNSVTGKNIGLAIRLQSTETSRKIWLSNQSFRDVLVLIVISSLDPFGPIPGGCNMEFPVEIAPYLRLKSDSMLANLEFQHASFGAQRDEPVPKCIFSSLYISYEVYVLFLNENDFGEEEYFQKVKYMSDVLSIKDHATKVLSYSLHPDTRYSFLAYPNLGVVYNVIAKYTVSNEVKEAAYIPIVTYGCTSSKFTEYGCIFEYSIKGKAFLFVLSIYGFIVAFFGHSIFGGDEFLLPSGNRGVREILMCCYSLEYWQLFCVVLYFLEDVLIFQRRKLLICQWLLV